MKSKLISALIVSAALSSLLPATALADSTVRYTNRAGRLLHIYYSVVPNGVTIDCGTFSYAGTLAPGASWSHSVPTGRWTWVRFQEDTRDAGCASYNNKFESRFSGSSNGVQAVDVW